MAREDTAIGQWRFFADDLDGVEIIAEAGLRQLAFLIEKVALGDEQDAVFASQRLERLMHMRQGFDRVLQHLAAEAEDFGNDARGGLTVGHVKCCLDHRQREAFDAIAIEGQVAALGFEQAGGNDLVFAMFRQQCQEALLGHAEEGFVLPQRVIGIKTDGGDGGFRHLKRPSRRGR